MACSSRGLKYLALRWLGWCGGRQATSRQQRRRPVVAGKEVGGALKLLGPPLAFQLLRPLCPRQPCAPQVCASLSFAETASLSVLGKLVRLKYLTCLSQVPAMPFFALYVALIKALSRLS